jgi:hypothetical protein
MTKIERQKLEKEIKTQLDDCVKRLCRANHIGYTVKGVKLPIDDACEGLFEIVDKGNKESEKNEFLLYFEKCNVAVKLIKENEDFEKC